MSGEKDLSVLLKTMTPKLQEGDYVFCAVDKLSNLNADRILCTFREHEAITVILHKPDADFLGLHYHFTASWITLTVHSSLEAVGLIAAVASALAEKNISCNVVAAFFHDHIFIAKKDAQLAMEILLNLSSS